MSLVRSASWRRLSLDSRHIRAATPFSLTSIRIRIAITSTAAPPAMTRASPLAGALASPFTMTTNAAMTTATAAMIVAAPALVTGTFRAGDSRRRRDTPMRAPIVFTHGARPSRQAATTIASCSRMPSCPPKIRVPTPRESATVSTSSER